uniref:Pre-C2HC domain-containing protein n=1 Tax=Anopheles atroparvus TaxID=41427 RepID=A0AAG5DTS6_ANOAO
MADPHLGWTKKPPAANRNAQTVPDWMNDKGNCGDVKFLLMCPAGNNALPQNPFVIKKTVEQHVGKVDGAYPIDRHTKYVIKVRSEDQYKKIQKINKLCTGTPVIIEPHPTLNSTKCVVSCPAVRDLTEDEICTELKDQDVLSVRRFTIMREGKVTPTNTLVVTLNKVTVPDRLYFGYVTAETRPYYPSPLRCKKCFAFGHTAERCSSSQKCHNCGDDAHGECGQSSKCVNCDGNHPSTSRNCPEFKKEQAIITLKVDEDLTYVEAR